ncbi:MAG: hypothetical protein S0880_17550 [Actinomycetota bacterium]|nr:hypothetical protein [Actinomycetota bacterium]
MVDGFVVVELVASVVGVVLDGADVVDVLDGLVVVEPSSGVPPQAVSASAPLATTATVSVRADLR